MNQKVIPTLIGVFVVGAATLAVAGLVYFGGGEAFVEKRPFVMYFDGSLKGLGVGAPVTFRGVRLGNVTRVVLRYYADGQRTETPVFVELLPDAVEYIGDPGPPGSAIPRLVDERGLRAQLAQESFVTGKLSIQLDFHPGTELRRVGSDPDIPEIPTIPSAMEELQKTIESLPIKELVADLRSAIQGIDELARSPELKEAIRSLDETLDEFATVARNVDAQLDPLSSSATEAMDSVRDLARSPKVGSALDSFDRAAGDVSKLAMSLRDEVQPVSLELQKALTRATETLIAVQGTVRPDGMLHHELVRALQEVSEAAEAVSDLAEMLERRPEVLLQGK